jgi:hypothetical protein
MNELRDKFYAWIEHKTGSPLDLENSLLLATLDEALKMIFHNKGHVILSFQKESEDELMNKVLDLWLMDTHVVCKDLSLDIYKECALPATTLERQFYLDRIKTIKKSCLQ